MLIRFSSDIEDLAVMLILWLDFRNADLLQLPVSSGRDVAS